MGALARLRRSIGFAATILLAGGVFVSALADQDTGGMVRFDAIATTGAPLIQDRMDLDVWLLEAGKPVRRVAERHAIPAEVQLPAGSYRIAAEYRDARVVEDIEVSGEGYERRTINLKAGEIRLKLLPEIGAPAVTKPIVWEVRRYQRGAEKGHLVTTVEGASPKLLLRQGWYEVSAVHNEVSVEHVVEVTAGQRFDYSLVMK